MNNNPNITVDIDLQDQQFRKKLQQNQLQMQNFQLKLHQLEQNMANSFSPNSLEKIDRKSNAIDKATQKTVALTQLEKQLLHKSNQIGATANQILRNYTDNALGALNTTDYVSDRISTALDKLLDKGNLSFSGLFENIIASLPLPDIFTPAASVFGSIFKFAHGGLVKGAGTADSDSILARLSDGEFVVNAQSTSRFRPLLETINNRYANGGLVNASNITKNDLVDSHSQNPARAAQFKIEVVNNSKNPLDAEQQITPNNSGGFDIRLIVDEVDRSLAERAQRDRSQLVNFIDQSRNLKKRGI